MAPLADADNKALVNTTIYMVLKRGSTDPYEELLKGSIIRFRCSFKEVNSYSACHNYNIPHFEI